MSGDFEPEGALEDCFLFYPHFQEDLEVLVREGYIQITSPASCKWLKSKTSLAEYFKWACGNTAYVSGGFWAPAENAFGIKRHSLRKLAGNNSNPLKPPLSRDFLKIKPILQQLRKQEEKERHERRIYLYIQDLFIFANDEKPETIRGILEKIVALFCRNVDKNNKNRRLINPP